jgi:hypothetical protein
MKIEEPSSLEDFLKIFAKYYSNLDNFYRGQADSEWDITPGIVRNKKIKNFNDLLETEIKLIEEFKRYISGNKLELLIPEVNNYDKSWVVLMAAQHYGLPTRLIDFTFDKYIALLFAVADVQHLNKDGAFIIYENPMEKVKDFSIFRKQIDHNLNNSYFFPAPILMNKENNEKRFSEIRKFIQASKFMFRDNQNLLECLSKDQEHANSLIKIIIPKEIKLDITKEIIKRGEMVYDLFVGKNELDYYAAILKLEFENLDGSKIRGYLKSNSIL